MMALFHLVTQYDSEPARTKPQTPSWNTAFSFNYTGAFPAIIC